MKHLWYGAALFCVLGAAHAEPGGTSNVSGPGITQGETEFEWRSATYHGGPLDESWAHRAQVSHGVTDWWRPSIIFRASQPSDANTELNSVAIENLFDITATRDWPVHFGVQLQYEFGMHGRDDEAEIKVIAEHKAGALTTRFNAAAERPVNGASDEWEHAYAARTMWRASPAFNFGVEAFAEPEVDAYYAGPRAGWNFGEVTLSAAYLAGFDDARADGQFRLALEFTP
jgi:hypothetical protein